MSGRAASVGGDVLDGGIDDFMDEADVLVFARHDPGDDLAPGDFGIDDGFPAAPTVIDHYDEILHMWRSA
ncbi:MAG: hypothetical protein H0V72_25950 [Bradyrhizobium sp.]|nr:hypothetical protein [Bradyrhizobium sp.]